MPASTLAMVDAELGRLRAATAAASGTLVDLDGDPVKCALERTTLRGRTRERWAVGAAALARLWSGWTSLNAVLEEATRLRGTDRKPGEDLVRRVTALVLGPSVLLDTGALPLSGRTLLGPAQTTSSASPEQVLAAMELAFDQVRGVLAEVTAATGPLETRLAAAEQLYAAALAEAGPGQAGAALHRVRGQLDALSAEVAADPLGCAVADLDTLARTIAVARAEAGSAAALRESILARMAAAHQLLTQLGQAREHAAETAAAAGRALVHASAPPVADPSRARELAALDALVAAGHLGDVGGRLAAWMATTREELSALHAASDGNDAALAERTELRGRLTAYRAKAGQLGAGEEPTLTALESTARGLLWTAPCDLVPARAAVAAYASAVARLGSTA